MMLFFGGRSSNSQKSRDRGKGVAGASSDDIDVQSGDAEYTLYSSPPPGYEERTPIHEIHSRSETEDPEGTEQAQEQATPEVATEEDEATELGADQSQGRPPHPLKSEIFTKHLHRVTGPDGKIRGFCNYYSSSYAWRSGDGDGDG